MVTLERFLLLRRLPIRIFHLTEFINFGIRKLKNVDIRHFEVWLKSVLQADSVIEFNLTQHFIFEKNNERKNSNRNQ